MIKRAILNHSLTGDGLGAARARSKNVEISRHFAGMNGLVRRDLEASPAKIGFGNLVVRQHLGA
jgi:hypothetical protein